MMAAVDFDEVWLRRHLAELNDWRGLCFAVACAERAFDFYELYTKDSGTCEAFDLRRDLDHLWAVGKEQALSFDPRVRVEACRRFIQEEPDSLTLEDFCVLEVVSSVYFCWHYLTQDRRSVDDLFWAASRTCAIAHQLAIVDLMKHPDMPVMASDDEVLAQPILQAELHRQREDLEFLVKGGSCEVVCRRAKENRITVPYRDKLSKARNTDSWFLH